MTENRFPEEYVGVLVTGIQEHEDGSATITFDLPEEAQKVFVELGLKLALYLHVYEMTEGELWDMMANKAGETYE